MVKHLHTLALRALQTNQQMSAHLLRVHSGFLPAKNIEQAQEIVKTMNEMLAEMQTALNSPPDTSHTRTPYYVPLK